MEKEMQVMNNNGGSEEGNKGKTNEKQVNNKVSK
jgi:hypothetical protein